MQDDNAANTIAKKKKHSKVLPNKHFVHNIHQTSKQYWQTG